MKQPAVENSSELKNRANNYRWRQSGLSNPRSQTRSGISGSSRSDIRGLGNVGCCDYLRVTRGHCHPSCQADDLELEMTVLDNVKARSEATHGPSFEIVSTNMLSRKVTTRPVQEMTSCLLPGTMIAHMLLLCSLWLISISPPREINSTQTS